MTFGILLLETKRELPIPAWSIGLLTFAILNVLLLITLAIGRGRLHS